MKYLSSKWYSVIKPFDPWKSPLCTCPMKWVLNVYTGCGHGCIYCYASSYIPNYFNPRPKTDLTERIRRDLKKIPRGALIELSTSSDPYTPIESKLMLTRRALGIILSNGMRVLITTKSSIVVRDLEILARYRGRIAVAITITTIRDDIAKKIEPKAPLPSERLKALEILSRSGTPVIVRIDPLIPGINDDYNDLRKLVEKIAMLNAKQVTSSTYKAKPDNLARMKKAFPELSKLFDELYIEKGMKIHGYRYLDTRTRYSYMKMVKEIVEEQGLVFQTCREGFPNLNTPGFACDGSTFTYEELS